MIRAARGTHLALPRAGPTKTRAFRCARSPGSRQVCRGGHEKKRCRDPLTGKSCCRCHTRCSRCSFSVPARAAPGAAARVDPAPPPAEEPEAAVSPGARAPPEPEAAAAVRVLRGPEARAPAAPVRAPEVAAPRETEAEAAETEARAARETEAAAARAVGDHGVRREDLHADQPLRGRRVLSRSGRRDPHLQRGLSLRGERRCGPRRRRIRDADRADQRHQLPFHPHLILIDPADAGGPTVEMDPFQAVHTRVATDAAGVPYLFGDEVGGLAVAYAARTASGWATKTNTPADSTQYFISGGAIAADRRAVALFAPADNNSLYLSTRGAAGGWSREVVSTTHSALAQALALGTAGQAYVAYQVFTGGQALLRLQQETSAPQLLTAYTSSWGSAKLDVVAPTGIPAGRLHGRADFGGAGPPRFHAGRRRRVRRHRRAGGEGPKPDRLRERRAALPPPRPAPRRRRRLSPARRRSRAPRTASSTSRSSSGTSTSTLTS